MSSTDPPYRKLSAFDWAEAGLFYHSLNFFYRRKFGRKVWKLGLDAGCGCPNRDGTLATSGCVFCDPASFSISRRRGMRAISDQLEDGIAKLKQRYGAEGFVAYFQPGTNTYGPLDRLHAMWQEAIACPDVVGLAIGTRPDCVSDEVLDRLAAMTDQTWVTLEYGLQTIHDRTLDRIHRGHHFDAFLDAYRRSRARGLDVGVHIVLGLPGESPEDMLATARELAKLEIHSVKLHNLYVVRNTPLADQEAAGLVRLPDLSEYVNWVVDFVEELPADVVIDRLSGDAPPEYLVGPEWCLNKAAVRTAIEAEFRRRGTRQGCRCQRV